MAQLTYTCPHCGHQSDAVHSRWGRLECMNCGGIIDARDANAPEPEELEPFNWVDDEEENEFNDFLDDEDDFDFDLDDDTDEEWPYDEGDFGR
jgi:transcription elongation factor Elf1